MKRAWIISKKLMVPIEEKITDSEDVGISKFVLDNDGVKEEIEIGDYKIMYSTGLKDVNDREIYEGDIVRIKHRDYDKENHNDVDPENVYQVYYKPEEKAFFIGDVNLTHSTVLNYEVIGNIYENPELI